jgi:hypothetical protein
MQNENGKVFQDGSVATETWKTTLPKIVAVLLVFITMLPWATLTLTALVIWFLSLGHVNFHLPLIKAEGHLMDKLPGG